MKQTGFKMKLMKCYNETMNLSNKADRLLTLSTIALTEILSTVAQLYDKACNRKCLLSRDV